MALQFDLFCFKKKQPLIFFILTFFKNEKRVKNKIVFSFFQIFFFPAPSSVRTIINFLERENKCFWIFCFFYSRKEKKESILVVGPSMWGNAPKTAGAILHMRCHDVLSPTLLQIILFLLLIDNIKGMHFWKCINLSF